MGALKGYQTVETSGAVSSRFSQRMGYHSTVPITVREAAPGEIRVALTHAAIQAGIRWRGVRDAVCRVLRQKPNGEGWDDDYREEAERLLAAAPWRKVYDVMEECASMLGDNVGPQSWRPWPPHA